MILWNTVAGVLIVALALYGRAEWVAGKRAARRMDFEARRAVRQASEDWFERALRQNVRDELRERVEIARDDIALMTQPFSPRLLAALSTPISEREFEILAGGVR